MPSPVNRWSEKMMWPGLLAAERQTALDHLLHHVLVADRAAHQLDAAVAQRDLEADVAHHRRDDGVAAEPPGGLQVPGAHQQHRVAVDDAARRRRRRSRDRRRRRTPRPSGSRARRTARASCSRVRRAAIEVDVAAVGRRAQHLDVEAELANSRGATVVVAPFAVSIGELERGRAAADPAAPAAACAM